MRQLIKLPINQVNISINKQFAYITYQLVSKYQQKLGDYLNYSTTITPSGDINIKITPEQNNTQSHNTYKSYPIYK